MMRPLIAVTCYPPGASGRVSLPAEYCDAIRRAGGIPVLVPPGEPALDELLARVDAVVLTGGGDLHPDSLGGANHAEVYGTDLDRDRLELTLVRSVIDHDVPTLAICRGLQVLNVALGGTLHLHVPDVFDGSVVHRAEPPGPVPHPVDVDRASLVGQTMGAGVVIPASWHHQGIDRLGAGLRTVAEAADGMIEAVELAGHRFLAAVQWHPEITAAVDPTQQALFDALVVAARP